MPWGFRVTTSVPRDGSQSEADLAVETQTSGLGGAVLLCGLGPPQPLSGRFSACPTYWVPLRGLSDLQFFVTAASVAVQGPSREASLRVSI